MTRKTEKSNKSDELEQQKLYLKKKSRKLSKTNSMDKKTSDSTKLKHSL